MIQYIKRKNLDIKKYDACVQKSVNTRIYALSYYLDIVADHWDALVLNDYAAVMPLPWRSKYFIKYIYPPCWTQQLGVFSTSSFDSTLVNDFIKAIPKKFFKTTILFNSGCKSSLKTIPKRNYILALNKNYFAIKSDYNKNRKRILSKTNTLDIVWIKNDSLNDFKNIFHRRDSNLKVSPIDREILFKLVEKSIKLKKGRIISININNQIEASIFISIHQNRITNLAPLATKKGKKENLPTLLINHIVQEYQNTNYILDFEGSMTAGVAQFYKSFGSKLEMYYLYAKKF